MAYGRICSCCGEKRDFARAVDAENNSSKTSKSTTTKTTAIPGNDTSFLFFCQPCSADDGPPDMSVHTVPASTTCVTLEASSAFEGLTDAEQKYALALSRADWEGAKMCLLQCSPESVPIFCLLQLAFAGGVAVVVERATAKGGAVETPLSQDDIDKALIYAAAFYGNMGNYKSFGDTKFVPDLSPEKMRRFLSFSDADASKIDLFWDACVDRMYSLPPRHRQLGLGAANGISTYFSSNCEQGDADLAGRFLISVGRSPYNTRLFKSKEVCDGDASLYTILVASADVDEEGEPETHSFEGATFVVQKGDHAPLMSRVVRNLRDAVPHAENSDQKNMIESYIASFSSGRIEDHKNGSRHWIRDKGPAVESYIGFIESYRDPSGVRGEWEGFVACVNREVSRKFGILVDAAEEMLKLMPWPTEFEKDVFLRPDFTSLEVLAFGSSGVPAGINIPNYDDIRQSEGFKNVSLGNVLAASYGSGDKPVPFVAPNDQALFKSLKSEAFEVQVGVHELLGHGSGKLYHADTDDAKALVSSNTLHPLTNEPITGPFYAPGAAYDSTFGRIASSYEECRAECSGLYLCLEDTVLQTFGHDTADAGQCGDGVHDIAYVNWLLMVRAGLTGLEFYTPATREWRQAHMRARYVILRVLLAAGDGIVAVSTVDGDDGRPDAIVTLDRSKIATVGRAAIGKFLLALQVHKSLGDIDAATALYEEYSTVTEEMSQLRDIVMSRKEPRKLMVQPHLCTDEDGTVMLQTFPATPAGMLESFAARFPAEDPELFALYERDLPHVSEI